MKTSGRSDLLGLFVPRQYAANRPIFSTWMKRFHWANMSGSTVKLTPDVEKVVQFP